MENELESVMQEAWSRHDALKGHPYWLNGDESLLLGLLDMYYDLTDFIWDEGFRKAVGYKRNPYWVAVSETHDLRGLRGAMRRGERYDEAELTQALQVYLQEYHLALEFDCDAYIEKLKAGGEPLRIFMIYARRDREKGIYKISLASAAACLSDDGSRIATKAWIESDEQLERSIKAYDDYVARYPSYVSDGFKEKWAKAREELLGGAVEAMDHYCAYRRKKGA